MGSIASLIIELVAGAAGGNAAGALLKQYNLGPIGNSIAGIVGGGLGGQLLSMVLGGAGTAGGAMDAGALVTQIVGGGVGGGILLVVVGIIRQALGQRT